MKSNYVWLIDAGHGGIDKDGNYQCLANGKRYQHPDFEILEGVINRQISLRLANKLTEAGVEFRLIYDEIIDWSLSKRVAIANSLQKKLGNCIGLSIHSNAGKGQGCEVYTSPGLTPSDIVAEPFCLNYIREFSEYKFRRGVGEGAEDSGLDKEAKFTMCTETIAPWVLVESFFFDEIKQAELLRSERGQERIVSVLFNSIVQIENTKPI